MSKFVIILVLYYYDGRVDEVNTSYFFPTAIECAKFKTNQGFKDFLNATFKDQGIKYVRPHCKVRQMLPNEIIARVR